MARADLAEIVSDAARELGLASSVIASPTSSMDANILQLHHLAGALGDDLCRKYRFSFLEKSYTFSTADGTAAYAMPSDFGRFMDGTVWNRTQQRPLLGPVKAGQWEALKGGGVTSLADSVFRVFSGNTAPFNIYPTPSAVETIAYGYRSKWWLDDEGIEAESEASGDFRTMGGGYCHFPARLMIDGLKMYFKRAKGMGFDQAAFDALVSEYENTDGAAPVLSLARPEGIRMIDALNLPDSGVGQ